MSENKKYYYLKFKENYFDQDHIKVIESMKNGYEYSLIILKLYLKSLKWEGQLMINERIPYTTQKIDLLAGVLNHDPANVMQAVNIAKELGIIEILDSGEIFLSDLQNFVGYSSTEAERKKKYRERLKCNNINKLYKKNEVDKNGTFPDKRPPEIEIEIEKEIEKEINIINKDFEKIPAIAGQIKICALKQNKFKYKTKANYKPSYSEYCSHICSVAPSGWCEDEEIYKECIKQWNAIRAACKKITDEKSPAFHGVLKNLVNAWCTNPDSKLYAMIREYNKNINICKEE